MTRLQRIKKLNEALLSMSAALDRVETEDVVASQCLKEAMREVFLVLKALQNVKRGAK